MTRRPGAGRRTGARLVSLNPGANTITVIAYDNSSNHNQTSQTITIYYDLVSTIYVSKDDSCAMVIILVGPTSRMELLRPVPLVHPSLRSLKKPMIRRVSFWIVDEEITLEGGWDTNFESCSSYTTINGSITITNGTMIIENIILK